MNWKEQIDKAKLPRHIAIIMDGNGRWAQKKGNNRIFGHKNGVKAVRDTVEGAGEVSVEYLTLYAFSTENWRRPKNEINALMSLLISTIDSEVPNLNKNNVKLKAIGDINSLPNEVAGNLQEAIDATAQNTGLTLILALSYSARWEISHAAGIIAEKVQKGELTPENIDEQLFSQHLVTTDFPDPELLIRTSGEFRISNFLLWQIAYAELYFTEVLWPDFRKENLFEAIVDFQRRERRFGKTSDQLKTKLG